MFYPYQPVRIVAVFPGNEVMLHQECLLIGMVDLYDAKGNKVKGWSTSLPHPNLIAFKSAYCVMESQIEPILRLPEGDEEEEKEKEPVTELERVAELVRVR